MGESIKKRYESSPFFGGNAPFIEDLYEQFLENPESVEPRWRDYFSTLAGNGSAGIEIPRGPILDEFAERARARRVTGTSGASSTAVEKQAQVMRLIESYRGRGHLQANVDPLQLSEKRDVPDLDPAFYGLTETDMAASFSTVSISGPDRMPLREIVGMLKETYCGTIGYEFMHVTNAAEWTWLKDRIECVRGHVKHDSAVRMEALKVLTAAEGLERYLHTKYVGQKRFSLEGGDSLIPLLHDIVDQAGVQNVDEAIIGMAHRGRLNVLINLLGKSPQDLFSEFEGVFDIQDSDRSGDVKYHMGFSSDLKTPGGNLHLVLAFNPSHLEIVNPVVTGSVRARQERRNDKGGKKVLPILVHGDAAFAGQGVVMETLQLSQVRGFYTGGTVHVVINNQVGFTISKPEDSRSTPYCTDIAKMLEAPIFHVNADDPDAVITVSRLALDYRMQFNKDVVIDLVCYRRHGHNEADEPMATQPVMYKTIKKHPTTRKLYADRLVSEKVIDDVGAKKLVDDYRDGLDRGETVAHKGLGLIGNEYTIDWGKFNRADWDEVVDTSLTKKRIKELAGKMTAVPEGMPLHNRVQRVYDDRRKMIAGDLPLDWGFAETLAYASIVTEGYKVRLTGQDAGRGTFFHRHAVLHNQNDASIHIPLQHVDKKQAAFEVIDSLLSEEAVLGFEYGYTTADPNVLVIWEAQFGDFANGAQVVIDQFIASGESKWGRLCGLTLFLPHGYEGQGPEHSSGRLERYLQLCAEHNQQVCVPSTPAQMFHMLRRQIIRPFRKPLIVMTPKSLLRHKLSVSTLQDISGGNFQAIIPEIDTETIKPAKAERLVFCSGKVYFDLLEARREAGLDNVALIRIEQLYPFPQYEYINILAQYGYARDIVWCQEEPENQGAWYQIHHRLQGPLKTKHTLSYAGRDASASTAAGKAKMHVAEQNTLIKQALGIS